jgi:hypothetical protein
VKKFFGENEEYHKKRVGELSKGINCFKTKSFFFEVLQPCCGSGVHLHFVQSFNLVFMAFSPLSPLIFLCTWQWLIPLVWWGEGGW